MTRECEGLGLFDEVKAGIELAIAHPHYFMHTLLHGSGAIKLHKELHDRYAKDAPYFTPDERGIISASSLQEALKGETVWISLANCECQEVYTTILSAIAGPPGKRTNVVVILAVSDPGFVRELWYGSFIKRIGLRYRVEGDLAR
jgi:hypothetical protein